MKSGVTDGLCQMEGSDEDNETYVEEHRDYYFEEREKAKKRAMEEMQRGGQ